MKEEGKGGLMAATWGGATIRQLSANYGSSASTAGVAPADSQHLAASVCRKTKARYRPEPSLASTLTDWPTAAFRAQR